MKVGIFTFHRAENFGAVLQAYALQTYIQGKGYDAYIIDYRPNSIETMYHIFNPAILVSRKNILISLKAYLKRFPTVQERRTRKNKYSNFRDKYLHLAKTSGLSHFDALITGSDQVWNLHLTRGYDRMYFLDIPEYNDKIKLSYAASADNDPDHLMFKHRKKISSALASFTAISVREEFLKEDISHFTDKEVKVCLDPTLLLSKTDYELIATEPIEKNYILVYQMTQTEIAIKAARKLAAETGLAIVEIYGGYVEHKSSNVKHGLGPQDLLGYIMNANTVVTTSFHGLALSVISQKDVWVVDKGDNQRQRNLMAKLGIEDRLIHNTSSISSTKHIDFERIERELDIQKKHSMDFLDKYLR